MTDRIPNRARNLRRYAALFDGANDGLFTLPPVFRDAHAGILRIAAEQAAIVRPDLQAAEAAYVESVVALAGREDGLLPPVDTVHDVALALARADRRGTLLARALEVADNRFANLAEDLGDTIIGEHLRPAVDDVMAGITKAAKALPDDPTAETVLRSNDAARKAWFSLSDLAARYDAIRRAAAPLRQQTPAEWDHRGDFSELHNFDQLTAGMNIQMGGPRPWPVDTGARLLWYVRHNGCVWLPTVAEQDARYREVHKDAIAQQEGVRARQLAAQRAFG